MDKFDIHFFYNTLVPSKIHTIGKLNANTMGPGVTHKKDWDVFSRAIQSRKFPIKLSQHVQKDKVGLFNEWLNAGHSFDKFLGF